MYTFTEVEYGTHTYAEFGHHPHGGPFSQLFRMVAVKCCLFSLSEGPSEVILSPSLPPASQASTSGSPVIADSCFSPVPDGLCHNSAFILGTPWD